MFPRTPLIPVALIVPFIALTFAHAAPPQEKPEPPPVTPTLAGTLGYPYSDHAVLQQKIALPVWGWSCLPGTKVTVTFNGQTKQAVADPQGGWKLTLDPMVADKLSSPNESPVGREMAITYEKDGEKAAITHQGESNARQDGYSYLPKLSSLIKGWRQAWNQPGSKEADGPQGKFSCYYVQLPGIGESDKTLPEMGDGRAAIRRAFSETLKIGNTGMAVCHDIGAKGEHPPNKYDTGIRLAQLALHHDYGRKDLIPSGPLYKSHETEGSTVRIRFDCAEGLMVATKEGFPPAKPTPDAKLAWLSIQSKDGTWHWADGKIDGSELIVSSPEVSEPVAVRYAYTNNPNGPLLYNRDGLPAAPFATDVHSAPD